MRALESIRHGHRGRDRPTCVASLENLALLDIQWRRLSMEAALAQRVLRALEGASITVWMTNQSAHGQAAAFVIPRSQLDRATSIIREELALEFQRGELNQLHVREPVTLLTLVMEETTELENAAGQLFSSLASVGVSIKAITQGASSRSISCVIASEDTVTAVRTVHTAFNFSHQKVNLLILGKGIVGSELISQITRQQEALLKEHRVRFNVVGLLDSRRALYDEQGIAPADLKKKLAAAPADGSSRSIEELLERLRRLPVPVLVDCTAANEMEALYSEAFDRGVHVVTANKKPLTSSIENYRKLMTDANSNHRAFSYETTVGASLPVIETLKDLVRTGDHILLIEGALSGTLGYITNELMAGRKLSSIVRTARELGYTEPQPQEDLSGTDVARKALILARELGLSISMTDVHVEPLVPQQIIDTRELEPFFSELQQYDSLMAAKVAELKQKNLTLRYLARIDPSALQSGSGPIATVGPIGVSADHPAMRLRGSEAFVAFTTSRYQDYPLLVQGAGAGGAVTAAGVLAGAIRVALALRGG